MTVGSSIITSQVTNWESDFSPENLITNLGIRGCSSEWNPVIGVLTRTTDFNSCLRSNESLMTSNGDEYVIPIMLDERIYNRGVLIVEGHSGTAYSKSGSTVDQT